MAQRFFNQSSRIRYVKPYINKRKMPIVVEDEIKEEKKEEEDMKLIEAEKLDNLLNDLDATLAPKKKAKIEKKDRGLIERTQDSKIILTEDNKMLLKD